MKKPSKSIVGMVVDDRPVESLTLHDGDVFLVGNAGITAFSVYRELDGTPWVAVLKGEEIVIRIPAGWVAIKYETEPRP